MDYAMLIEMIGYLGSLLVVISMLMSSVIKLRLINTVGSAIFTAYALIIHSYPTAFMNFCLIVINVYNLAKLLKSSQQYDLVEGGADEAMVDFFLNYYKEDIARYFPGFRREGDYDAVYLVLCSSNPAGILLGKRQGDGIDVVLDYTTPVYRDCSAGRYLYSRLGEMGLRRLRFVGAADRHEPYLKKMGFVPCDGVYVKTLA